MMTTVIPPAGIAWHNIKHILHVRGGLIKRRRDFTFVKDEVEANILAAERHVTRIFNIGRGEKTSINRLAELIIQLVGNNVELVYKAPRSRDVKQSPADISQARTFGYGPKYSLEDGL